MHRVEISLDVEQRQVGARAQRNAAACARLDAARLARTCGTRSAI
jgi:hypothetical protein